MLRIPTLLTTNWTRKTIQPPFTHHNMSLRRSARVASTSAAADTNPNNANGLAKTAKPKKTTPTPRKRKPEALPSPPQLSPQGTTNLPEEPHSTSLPSNPNPPAALPRPKKRKTKAPSQASVNPPPPQDHLFDTLASLPRPANPHTTNAPLASPNGTQIVAYTSSPTKSSESSPTKRPKKAKEIVPPDVGVLPAPHTDIDNLLLEAEAHLIKMDEKLRPLVEKYKCGFLSPEGLREVVDPFTALCSGIIGQQVSSAAASSIRSKFTSLFPLTHPSFPTPQSILTLPIPTLRTAGLSQRKAEYITGLASLFASGELSAEMLVRASDEEMIEKLVAVRGLGRWSVEMFACFGLKRVDVFSVGDLGVQRGMAVYTGRDINKLKAKGGKWKYMSEQEMLDIAAKFSPYRSLFMWYMWRIADVDVSGMHKT
ncbi:hypothetical protein NX059_009162 [Plenodomus lindquistii]|nr:hypothetical protein NX059_009162 [Plenodomus lindquistii]